jgi:phosphatidylglycerol:prolipoprotein diacylglycerol transferase
MLIHPLPDPVAFSIGPLSVHWYGIMYMIAFGTFMGLARLRIRQPHIVAQGWNNADLDDLLFYGVLGVVIGGRLGEVLFYNFDKILSGYYLSNPLDIIAVWKGGMSFHGGYLGVLTATWLWARKTKRTLLDVWDFIAPMVPFGYGLGRVGNFINAELPGRVADPSLPWAMIWPNIDQLPRHPSPLYQALVDGLLAFLLLWWFARQQRPRLAVGAMYTLLYGCARFFTEYFRTPDYEVSALGITISAGQMFSFPMIIAALMMLAWVYKFPVYNPPLKSTA